MSVSSNSSSAVHSRYLWRTSGGNSSTRCGARSNRLFFTISPTLLTPSFWTSSQLRRTAASVCSADGIDLELVPCLRPEFEGCERGAVSGKDPAPKSVSSLWSAEPSSANSRKRILSFTWCPRGRPRSFKSLSSASARVSISSKPLRTRTSAYWPKPAPRMKATTALLSSSLGDWGPPPASPRISCSRRWSVPASRGAMPASSMSAYSISSSVSISSKPLSKTASTNRHKPSSTRRTATGLSPSARGPATAPAGTGRLRGRLACGFLRPGADGLRFLPADHACVWTAGPAWGAEGGFETRGR
mmetsp:Transcript_81378/g.242556  ORF Transcript_81378/g.242556 Transcript_81378/m.242556 type:complete len:302 (-) Transcript_81378:96-1001(-)